jgi:hypothetical protein
MMAIASSLDGNPWIELLLAIPAGWLAYLAAHWLLDPDAIRYLRNTMFPQGRSGGGGSSPA